MQDAAVAASVTAARSILIIEDDESFASILRAALQSRNYRVAILHNAADAAGALARNAPDLLVLDVFLNGISGVDVLRTIRRTHPRLPVLMMSGMGTVALAVESIKLGATDFLEKPFSIDSFVERVARCVDVPSSAAPSAADKSDAPRLSVLTGREHEVLAQIARGASSKEAGRVLGISPRTVDVHRARIKEKLNVRRAVDLVRLVYSGERLKV